MVLNKDQLAADSARVLSEEAAERQATMLATIEERPVQLNTEIAAAVVDLRDLYLYVLDNMNKPGPVGEDVVQRTRQRASDLRTRMEAERDLQRFLAAEKDVVH